MKNKRLIFFIPILLIVVFSTATLAAREVDNPTPTPSQLELLVQSDHARGDYTLLEPVRPGVSYPNPPEQRTVHIPPCLRVVCGTPAPR